MYSRQLGQSFGVQSEASNASPIHRKQTPSRNLHNCETHNRSMLCFLERYLAHTSRLASHTATQSDHSTAQRLRKCGTVQHLNSRRQQLNRLNGRFPQPARAQARAAPKRRPPPSSLRSFTDYYGALYPNRGITNAPTPNPTSIRSRGRLAPAAIP